MTTDQIALEIYQSIETILIDHKEEVPAIIDKVNTLIRENGLMPAEDAGSVVAAPAPEERDGAMPLVYRVFELD